MSKRKSIAILAIIAMVLTLMPAAMFGATADSDRLAGANRIETALEICDAGWETADTVILAAADEANLVDALAAGPLAAQEDAPILVTYKNALNADVKAKIADLGASKVIVVGAVSDDVVAEVKTLDGVAVEKIAGKNRIETANLINAELDNVAGTFVVGYLGLPDALSVASYAAANNFAIAIAKADGTVDEESLLGETTYIVGGTARVADIDGAADRFAGSDRLATNAAVAKGLEFDFAKVYVANGRTLVDALAVAPLAAKTDSFVLLVEANKGAAVEGMTAASQIIAVGGTAAVPQKVLDGLFGGDDGEFTIKSVKAPNLIQLKLELSNTDYDKDDLTDPTNYELEAIAKNEKDLSTIDVAKASVKDKILTLTLEGPVKNETQGTLTVDKIITGEELVFENIKFSDHSIPTIEDVLVIGKDTVKFVFSEPVISNGLTDEFDFEQGNSSFSVKDVIEIKDGLEANVVVYDNFEEGKLTVKVGNGLEDYAGFNIIPKTFEVDVVEDITAPTVTGYKDAKRDQVTLIFSEDIQILSQDIDDYYHTNTDNKVDGGSIIADTSNPNCSVNGNELTLKFSTYKLPEGVAYVYVKADAVSDLWDNKNSTIKTKVEISVDKTKPTISSVEWKNDEVVVNYSEPMDNNAIDRSNYTMVDPDNKEISIKTPYFKDAKQKKVAFELRDNDPKAGDYKLTVEKAEDKAGNAITKTTVEVNITGTGSLSMGDVTQALYDQYSSSRYRIYLEFGKKLATEGNFSVLDLYKYTINGQNLGKLNADKDAYFAIDLVDDGKTVRITTDYDFDNVVANPAAYAIQIISRIADINGNYTAAATSASLTFTDISSQKIGINGVSAKSATTVEVTFTNGFISSYNVGDFVVWQENQSTPTTPGKFDATDKEFNLRSIAQGADPDKAIITLVDKKGNTLPADAAGIYVGTKATTKSKNAAGRLLEAGIGMTSGDGKLAADKIAPSVKLYDDQDTRENNPTAGTGVGGTTDKVEACWAEYDTASNSSLIYIEFNEAIANVTSASGIDVKINNKSVPFAKITNVSVAGAVLKIQVENNEAIEAGDTIILGDSVIRDTKGNRAGKIEVSVEYEVDDTATIPAFLTPDAGKSGITTKTPGAKGSKEVNLVITVANFNNDGLPGYEAEDFSVEIDGADAVDFTNAAFGGFTDNGDGTYSVTYTGAADAKDYSFTISVGGVEIVTADTVTTPANA